MRAYLFRTLLLSAMSVNQTPVGPVPDVFFFASAYDNSAFAANRPDVSASSIPIPKGIRQALLSEHSEYWLEAIYTEYHSILSHNVFEVVRRVDVPTGSNVMRCHCIFTCKSNSDGSIERFKCRCVCDGNTQVHGLDFDEIFSTVFKFSTFRMALHIAAARDYNITSVDISTAFLYGSIDVEAYMQMPEGLPRYDADGYELVCRLLKSIYGLKQAPRIWFNHFRQSLIEFGFTQSTVDPCLFIFKRNSTTMYALLWVDDLILLENSSDVRAELLRFLKARYKLTDKGPAHWLLGVAIKRDREARTITLSQELYVKTFLARFAPYLDQSNARSFDVPALDEINSFTINDCPAEGSAEYEQMRPLWHVYMQIVGGLIWLTSVSFPHLCVATMKLSRFTINPHPKHFAALMRILLYLGKHTNESLTLGGKGPNVEVLQIVTDASHETEASMSGVLILMGAAVIDWICRRQKSTARSSLESEALSSAEGAQDGIHKRELGKEFGVEITTTNFWTDSDSSVKLHKNQYACKRSGHIIRVISMLRHWILTHVYAIFHVAGNKNPADLLTKPLALEPFSRYKEAILKAKVIMPEVPTQTQTYTFRLTNYILQSLSLPHD